MLLTIRHGFWAPPRSTQTCSTQCQGAAMPHISSHAASGQPSLHSCLVTCLCHYFRFLMLLQEKTPPLRCRQHDDRLSHLLSVIWFTSRHWLPPKLLILIAFQTDNIYCKQRHAQQHIQQRKLMPKPDIFEAEPYNSFEASPVRTVREIK